MQVIFLTFRGDPTEGLLSALGWGSWGKGEMQEKRYRAGEWECPIVRGHLVLVWSKREGERGKIEQEQTVEERRDGTRGLRKIKTAGCGFRGFRVRLKYQWAGAEGQPLGVGDAALYSAPWFWEGDRGGTMEPSRN